MNQHETLEDCLKGEKEMKIALAQMEVFPNQPERNVNRMLELIAEAKSDGVDLIAFPEMAVGGYLVGDKWLSKHFGLNLMEYNKTLQNASDGIAIAYGNIFVDTHLNERVDDPNGWHPNMDGRVRKYNAIYVFQNKKPVMRLKETNILPTGVQPKALLPNYRFFDDKRYFFSFEDVAKDFSTSLQELAQPFLIDVNGEKIPVGFELCEDLWVADYRKNGKAINLTNYLINNGAQIIINHSSSPWTYGKNGARDRRVAYLKKEAKDKFVSFYYVNCTGIQNNGKNIISFDGGSTVYNKDGQPVIFNKELYEEELIIVDNNNLPTTILERKDKSKIAEKYEAIIQGLRHVRDTVGEKDHPKYVIGLSGGVDSSVVAALLVKAVGANKVLGINMPSCYNSDKTKDAAAEVARKLNIGYVITPIQEMVDVNTKLLEATDIDKTGRKLSTLNEENLQAKIRGTSILSNIAAKYNALFTNNGNKVETALGYATLYGDVGGAIAPIADLTKEEVFELAHYLNDEVYGIDVIPKIMLPDKLFRFGDDQIKPSAELKNDQVDPIKFGYHDRLLDVMTDYKKRTTEDVLQWYIDGTLEKNLGISNELVVRWGLDNPKHFIEDLEWFDRTIQKNVFKRIQSPPIILTSKSAYGFDIRESLLPYEHSIAHNKLKKYILLNMTKYHSRKLVITKN